MKSCNMPGLSNLIVIILTALIIFPLMPGCVTKLMRIQVTARQWDICMKMCGGSKKINSAGTDFFNDYKTCKCKNHVVFQYEPYQEHMDESESYDNNYD